MLAIDLEQCYRILCLFAPAALADKLLLPFFLRPFDNLFFGG